MECHIGFFGPKTNGSPNLDRKKQPRNYMLFLTRYQANGVGSHSTLAVKCVVVVDH